MSTHKDVIGECPEPWQDRSKRDFFEVHCFQAIVGGQVQGYYSNEKCAASTVSYLRGPHGPYRGAEGSVVMQGGARL